MLLLDNSFDTKLQPIYQRFQLTMRYRRKVFQISCAGCPLPALYGAFTAGGSLLDECGVPIDGSCAPGFERVRDAFESNFTDRDDVGAAVAVWVEGDLVVNLWGGFADAAGLRPWREDTLASIKPHIRDVLAAGEAPGYPASLAEHPMAGLSVAMGFYSALGVIRE